MKIIKQIFVILMFYVLGEMVALGIRAIFPSLFVPGTIIGLGLLLMALGSRLLKLEHVDDVGSFLTSNMAFFFIPAAVSVLEYMNLLQSSITKIILIIVISIIFSFFMVTLSIKGTLYLQKKWLLHKEQKRSDDHA